MYTYLVSWTLRGEKLGDHIVGGNNIKVNVSEIRVDWTHTIHWRVKRLFFCECSDEPRVLCSRIWFCVMWYQYVWEEWAMQEVHCNESWNIEALSFICYVSELCSNSKCPFHHRKFLLLFVESVGQQEDVSVLCLFPPPLLWMIQKSHCLSLTTVGQASWPYVCCSFFFSRLRSKKELVEGKALGLHALCSHPHWYHISSQRCKAFPVCGFTTTHMLQCLLCHARVRWFTVGL